MIIKRFLSKYNRFKLSSVNEDIIKSFYKLEKIGRRENDGLVSDDKNALKETFTHRRVGYKIGSSVKNKRCEFDGVTSTEKARSSLNDISKNQKANALSIDTEIDDTYLASIGKSYLFFLESKKLLNQNIKKSAFHNLKGLLPFFDSPNDLYINIGKLILNHIDKDSIDVSKIDTSVKASDKLISYINDLINTQSRTSAKAFTQYFNSLVPEFNLSMIDEKYLDTKFDTKLFTSVFNDLKTDSTGIKNTNVRLNDYLKSTSSSNGILNQNTDIILNVPENKLNSTDLSILSCCISSISNDKYRLPKMNIEFNPLFLSDKIDFSTAYSKIFTDTPNPLLLELLNQVYALGKYSFEFYSSVLNISLSTPQKLTLIKNSLILKSVKSSSSQSYLNEKLKDSSFIDRIFFQCVGLATLDKFPIDWLTSLRNFESVSIPTTLPQNPLQISNLLSNLENLSKQGLGQDELKNLATGIIEKLGQEALRHSITTLIVNSNQSVSNLESLQKKLIDQFLKEVPDENKIWSILGSAAWKDYNILEEYIHNLFLDQDPNIKTRTHAHIKFLISKYPSLPLYKIPSLDKESKVSLPHITNTVINQFFMLNPNTFRNDKSGEWKNDADIQLLIINQAALGKSIYSFEKFYYQSKFNVSREILKLLDFDSFRRLLIDHAGFFQIQDDNSELLLKESISKVSFSQLWLYISLLSSQELKQWLKKVTRNISDVKDLLEEKKNVTQEQNFVKFSYTHLFSNRAALGILNQGLVRPRIQAHAHDITRHLKDSIRLNHINRGNFEVLGREYVKFIVRKSNLGLQNVDANILNQDIVETMYSIFSNELYQDLGILVNEGRDWERVINRIIKEINHYRYIPKFKLDLVIEAPIGEQRSEKGSIGPFFDDLTLPLGLINNLTKFSFIPNGDRFKSSLSFLNAKFNFKEIRKLNDKSKYIMRLGEQYFRYSVLKTLSRTNIDERILEELTEILTDLHFTIAVGSQNSLLQYPFKNIKFIDSQKRFFQELNFIELTRDYKSSFYSYCGNLALQEPRLLDKWVDDVVYPIIGHLNSINQGKQEVFLDELYNSLVLNTKAVVKKHKSHF